MKRIWAIAVSAALCWAGTVQAGQVDFKNVAADAKWVAHLDIDAAHSSQVVKSFFGQCAKDCPAAKEKIQSFWHKLGLDDCKKLHGITAYGTRLSKHSKVLILRADWDAKALQEKAEKAPDHKVTDYGHYKIHTFTAHKESKHSHEVAGTLYKPDTLVLACSVKKLKAAIDVLDGKGSNLAGKQSPLAAKVPQGTVILVRAVDLKDSKVAQCHPALELVKSFCYEKGEHDGKWFGNLAVTMGSKSSAEKAGKVLEGYLAWLSLHGHKCSWFVDVLNKVKVKVDGNTVKTSFEEKADTLTAHMSEICKAVHEHMKMWMHRMWHGKSHETMHKPASCPVKEKSSAASSCPTMKKESRAATTTGAASKTAGCEKGKDVKKD